MIAQRRQPMDNQRLYELIEEIGLVIDGQMGHWVIDYRGRQMIVITDEPHNRMRVMTPIVAATDLTSEDQRILLQANFDRALDARYAVSNGHLWALYMHPLAELSENQFRDACEQVARLFDNYGTTYSSSDLMFGGD